MLTDSSDRNLKRAAYLAIAINFTYYLARACSKKYVLGLATLYSNSGVVAGFVYSLYTIAQLAAALVVGRLADKHGNKPPLISGAALMTAGATIVAFSGGLFPVAAGNILLGAAHGLILTASQAVVVSVRDSYEKSKLAGYFYFSNSLGGFAGGVVGG
jgi:MFS family permease